MQELIIPLTKKEQVAPARRLRCVSCPKVATVKYSGKIYCKGCAVEIKAQRLEIGQKEDEFLAGGMIELPKSPHFYNNNWGDSPLPTLKAPWIKRCRVAKTGWTVQSRGLGVGGLLRVPCGSYIPDHWEMCQNHLLEKYGLDTTSCYDDSEGLELDQVIQTLLRLEGRQ